MKRFKKAVMILSLLSVFILTSICTSLLSSYTGYVFYFNKHVQLEFAVEEEINFSDYFLRDDSDNTNRQHLDRIINQTHMSQMHKRQCLNAPEDYCLVRFKLNIKNKSEFDVYLKPLFSNTKDVWLINKHVDYSDGARTIYCEPGDETTWYFYAIEKSHAFTRSLKPKNFRSILFAKIPGGPYVHMSLRREMKLTY